MRSVTQRLRRPSSAAAAACFVALALAGPASADRGVALDLGKLEIAEVLTPGGGYRLPAIGVRNPGDEATTYRMTVSSVRDQAGVPVPEAWIDFEPGEVTLAPGQTEKVQARLSLPTGADPGDYEGLLAAQIVSEGKGAQGGAAAAAKLTFEVESATLLGAWWHRLSTWFEDNTPWTWVVTAMLASVVAARQFRRRFAFRLEKRA
jgi:hypothetical protein